MENTRSITTREINEDTIYFSTGISEWYADRLENDMYELRHVNKTSNGRGKYKAHRQNIVGNIPDMIKYIEKHDFRKLGKGKKLAIN